MIVIRNGINSSHELLLTPKEFGVKADVRSYNGSLVVQVNPFANGELLEDYLKVFGHKMIIFDVKSEGIENAIIETAEKCGVKDYFLVNVSAASAKKLVSREFRKFAVRFSDMEPTESCMLWAGKAEWIWADIFRDFSLDDRTAPLIKGKFRICAISPEMIGLRGAVERYRGKMNALKVDAVCTDLPDIWK